jgi:hypothetical protein
MSGLFHYKKYSDLGSTAAPVLDVIFSLGDQTAPTRSLLDSGASWTRIPYNVIVWLNLKPVGQYPHQDGEDFYCVDIQFDGFRFPNHPVYRLEALGGYERDFALIGREILNKYFVLLNGPPNTFLINEEPSSK